MAVGACCYVVTESVYLAGTGNFTVLLQCSLHMLVNIGTVVCQQVIFFPVEKKSGINCLHVVFTVGTPYNDIA